MTPRAPRAFVPGVAALALLAGCPPRAAAPPTAPKRAPMSQPSTCTRTVTPADAARLQAIVEELPEGATLCLGAGRYEARLLLQRPIHLRGAGPETTILDGGGNGPVLQLWADGGEIGVADLTLTGGSAQPAANAGAIWAHGTARVLVENVHLRGNACDLAGAQAVLTDAAPVVLARCRVEENHGDRAAALQADQIGALTLRDTLVANNDGKRAVMARAAARVTIERSTVVAGPDAIALDLAGNATQAPAARVTDSILVGKRAVGAMSPATARAERSVIDGEAIGLDAGGDNRAQPMRFAGEGTFVPAEGGPAIGLARNGAGLVDLAGRARRPVGAAGAFEAP